jgi:hypothetical protein
VATKSKLWAGAVLAAFGLAAACQVDGRFVEISSTACVSEQIWTYADKDSPLMTPGRSCVQCHAETNDEHHAPLYEFAGTVMLDLHEGDDCRGAPEMTVVLTDADGKEFTMPGNSAGNFWLPADTEVAMPYTARIIDKHGNERVKQVPVDNGDCASCHTRDGANGAEGRLTPPEVQ